MLGPTCLSVRWMNSLKMNTWVSLDVFHFLIDFFDRNLIVSSSNSNLGFSFASQQWLMSVNVTCPLVPPLPFFWNHDRCFDQNSSYFNDLKNNCKLSLPSSSRQDSKLFLSWNVVRAVRLCHDWKRLFLLCVGFLFDLVSLARPLIYVSAGGSSLASWLHSISDPCTQ